MEDGVVILLSCTSLDLGHALACENDNAVLKCGSGQVIRIDDSFYGRKTEHYCRANHSVETASLQQECSWLSVFDSVSGKKKVY